MNVPLPVIDSEPDSVVGRHGEHLAVLCLTEIGYLVCLIWDISTPLLSLCTAEVFFAITGCNLDLRQESWDILTLL